jgi:amino acid adenylation domain-containing protein/thioester reductase-like protein
VIDLPSVAGAARDQEARRWVHDEVRRPLDLEAGPLARIKLLRFCPEDHALLVAAHTSIFDEESADILFREIIEAYEASLTGRQSRLSDPPRNEAESGRWHRHWLETIGKGAHVAFWRGQLSGELPILELPTDKPRPSTWSYSGASVSGQLPVNLWKRGEEASSLAGSSPFTIFLAAFVALLRRYTGQSDILVGTPVSGRGHPESSGLIGRFAYPVALRFQLSDDLSFAALVKRVEEVTAAAEAHEAFPFASILNEIRPADRPGRHPLFQVGFELAKSRPRERVAGLVVSRVDVEHDAADLDLALTIRPDPGGHVVTFTYSADLFERATIERMLDHYKTLITNAAERPDQLISRLPLLTAAERRRMLVEWNNTRTEYPRDACIHELFEAQARRTPDAIAAFFEGEELTYKELNRRANALAYSLISEGVKPDTPVAICVERSLEMVVGLLAILKAGGAYVPLDPKYPRDRIEFMLSETNARILLAKPAVASRLPFTGRVVGFSDAAGGDPDKDPSAGAQATSLAYVLFTSGSTGRPKAVAVPHRGVVRLVVRTNYMDIVASDRVLQANTLTFDASTLEIWAPLLHGARMVIVPQERLLSPPEFAEWAGRQGITVMLLTTALFHQYAAAIPAVFKGLRYLMFGGEACDPRWAREVLEKGPPQNLLNVYGPTENTQFSTVQNVRHVPPGASSVPIGPPIANSTAYVLDRFLQPVPVGVIGELYVGGDGLARGYMNRPELTAAAFIKSPLPENPDAILYKTGDRARYLPDGTIDFLGRMDDQVKIRGYRVELGEIEAVLGSYAAVREVAVVVRSKGPGEKRLVAYLSPVDGAELTVPGLRSFLQSKLPNFMIPSVFVILDKMPLTSHGKIDRRALPEPLVGKDGSPASSEPPSTEPEDGHPRGSREPAGSGSRAPELNESIKEIEAVLSQHAMIREAFVVAREAPGSAPRLVAFFVKKATRAPSEDDLRRHLAERLPTAAVVVSAFIPLVTEQDRVLAVERESPGNSACIHVMAARIDGPLDMRVLRRAVNEVVRRQPALRTTFPIVKGKPSPRINTTVLVEPAMMDFALLPDYLWEGEILRQAAEEAQRPFDLATGPLLRVSLLRFSRDVHVLLVAAHKAVFDDASGEILLAHIAANYPSVASGTPSTPPDALRKDDDPAGFRRAWLQASRVEERLSYWRERLSGGSTEIGLFTDRPRPVVRTFQTGSASVGLATELLERLRRLGEREGAPLEVPLLAAFTALLHRYTDHDEIVVGVPVSGRLQPESSKVIGRLGYSLPVCVGLSGDLSFRELLRCVAAEVASTEQHRGVPLAMLLEELKVPVDATIHPLFQVGFELRREPATGELAPGLTVAPLEVERVGSELDLTLIVSSWSEVATAALVYNADLWEPETIERMLEHLRTLLESAADDPEQSVSDLPLLSCGERHRLLVEWNDTQSEYPRDATLHELFERQVELSPDAVAAVSGAEFITYLELNQRANALAYRLMAEGVGPDVRVGVFADRSIETLIALVAILKAGGAYVPLDSSYPRERLQLMLADSGAVVLLASKEVGPISFEGRVIRVGQQTEAGAADENPASGAAAPGLAYVMFTSGSTGRPKGVGVTHRGVVRLVVNTNYIKFTRSDRVLHASNLSFDASTFEIWGALLNGGCLVIVAQDTLLSPALFSAEVRRRGVTIMLIPTALFHHMASIIPEVFKDLRYLVVGGDALELKWARAVLDKGCPKRLVNAYGPTENATISTAHLVSDLPESATSVPIGKPISNSQAYVVDRRLNPMPIGVPGELCVGGDGLAREYLNRPDLTAAMFVTTSFGSGPPVRVYRTGDRARWLPDGTLEFLGRADDQVKIRGFRVEIGEVEAAFSSLPGVREVVVLVKDEALSDKRLVAFVSRMDGDDAHLSSGDLRAAIEEKLPAFMVPSSIVVLDRFPLTPNGKVDRGALSLLERDSAGGERTFVAPRSAMEVKLSAIWSELLGVPRVGVHDNFFDLGGRSLVALRLLIRVRDEYQVDLPVRSLFDNPSIVGLASAIEEVRARGQATKLPPIKAVSKGKPLPLSFAQQQLWLLVQVEPELPFYNEPFTIRIPGALDVGALERTLHEIIRRHDILRTTFSGMRGRGGLSTAPRYSTVAWPVVGGGQRVMPPRPTMGPPSMGPVSGSPVSGVPSVTSMPMQLVNLTSTFTLAKIDLRDLPEAEREMEALRIARDEACRPFHLGIGPLIRATLVRLRDDDHRLFMTMHHIITDGISLHVVLIRELSVLYEAFVGGRPSPLQDLPIQFGDFALWQRRTYTVEALEPHIEYWDRKLVGASMLDLPLDRPRAAVKTFKGRKRYFALDAGVIDALRDLGRSRGATIFMVLLAAFKVLLHRYSGQDDILVGTVTSGRPRAELEELIGFFVNPVALRTDLRDSPTFLGLLDRVRDVTLEAYAHQDVPFEMLVEELRVVRTQSQNPLFQVAFVLEPSLLPLESGWTITQHDVDTGTSKFDLTLDIDDRPEGPIGRFEYDCDLFTAETIERMVAHFQALLVAIPANADRPIAALPLMSSAEEASMLERGRSRASVATDRCLHELFDVQAAKTPSASAIQLDSSRLTYRDLERRANQLANHLVKLGVGPEVLVAIYMERSLDVVVAILAVLKAGGAYVPLDPDSPVARISHILEDCGATVILTQDRLKEKLPATVARLVCLDGDRALIASEQSAAPQTSAGPDNLAYVIYSTGPSGKPKGVMIPHGNVVRLFRSTTEDFKFDERDVWTMFHSAAFDFSIWEIWGALLHGGKLVVVPKSTARSPEDFYHLLRTHRVTVLNLVPAAFLHLMRVEDDLDGVNPNDLSLRHVFLGGEAVDFRALKPWFDRHGDQRPRVWNLYGLTGATVFVTYRPITLRDASEITGSRLGRPVVDTELYILDRELRPVPVGVPGEIYIGGPGLARGYLNRPDLESERFIHHPWGGHPSVQLYRTYDRARYLADGDIEYMGRLDEQMKIRGFRVEPTEVEAVLLEHPDVREAVVTVREDTPGDQRLVAYYAKRGDRIPTTNEFRSFLRERLPDYLVPTIYIVLPSIPSMGSGKTNRRSLPPPDRNRPSLMPVFRLPSSAVEVLVLGIWTRLLQVNQIGRNDDFFSLGGHSLLAAQMIARIRETFRIDVRHSSFLLREFLETPTVAGLAEAVEMVRDATPSVRAKKGTSIDYDAEARLDFSIRFDAPRVEQPPDDPAAVLLTGATGFLGAFLLHELLKQTRADIYCLVRAPDLDAARKRIETNLRQNDVWDERVSARIIPVLGDLSQLLLGLSPEKFAELAEKLDVIYHNGSLVNFIYPYTALKAANVGGTQEVIRLATQARLKPVHYISTLAVLTSYGFLGVRSVAEDVPLAHANQLYMGYPESKYVAEKMLMQASQQGLPVSIYRPHDVTGHSQSGAWKTEGFLCSFLRSLFEIGAAPDLSILLDFAPVDYVTRAIVHIAMNEPAVGTAFHLNNPRYNKLSKIIAKMQALGYSIQKLPYHSWVQKLLDYTARNPTSSIAPFVPLFVERWSEAQISLFEMYSEERVPVFDARNTRVALQGTGIVCPPVDDALLDRYLKFFMQIGFLPPPPARG